MAVADSDGLPVAVCVESATPHEVKFATSTLVQLIVSEAPQNLIGDNAYDSDKLRTELRQYGIEVIAPHRCNRKNRTQDLRRIGPVRRTPLRFEISPELVLRRIKSCPSTQSINGFESGRRNQPWSRVAGCPTPRP